MSILAIIPARSGSKRIPNKNLLSILGVPLISYSIKQAIMTPEVDEVIVTTDSPNISHQACLDGATVVARPVAICEDDSTSESALINVLDMLESDPEMVVFLQCTSPLRQDNDITNAIDLFRKEKADSLFSACPFNKLIWDGILTSPLNYNYKARKREQEIGGQYQENGSIYIMKPSILRKHNNRLGGKISIYAMDYWDSFQIDEPRDVEMVSWLMSQRKRRPARIDLVVFDFDGVMTDNTFIVDSEGRESVVCNRGDGLGLARMKKRKIVLSTEKNTIVNTRCKKLGIDCYHGINNKLSWLKSYLEKNQIDPKYVAYLGNDVNDKGCLEMVGLSVVTADAHPEVLTLGNMILQSSGGKGAVRELCEYIINNYE